MEQTMLMIPAEEYINLLNSIDAWNTALDQMLALRDNVRGASDYVRATEQSAEILRLNGMAGGINLCLDILRKNMVKVCK